MKRRLEEFAVAGGDRVFASDLPVGQLYFPAFDEYERAMRDIIERGYYTNHGPLVRRFESELEEFLGVANVVTVTNATIGLYLVALALEITGKVLMPAFTFIATAQSAVLAGLHPVFCDVDPAHHQVTPSTASAALEDGVAAVVAVNLWGGSCDVPDLVAWAESEGLPIFFDSAHGFGSERTEGKLGRFGAAEVFSFHATKVLSSAEGGCVCTDDDELAERVRNMRSNYGIRRPINVPLTVNARLSEGQAAVGLLSLSSFEENRAHNAAIRSVYREHLREVPGVQFLEPHGVTTSNHQYALVEIDADSFGLSRDGLWTVLRSEGVRARRYFTPGVHRSTPFDGWYPTYVDALPVTDQLCSTVLQLPVGAALDESVAEQIASLVTAVHSHSDGLAGRV